MRNLILALTLTSCGAANNQSEPSNTRGNTEEKGIVTALGVNLLSDRPACTASNNYQLVYVKEDKKFYNCQALVWENIDINPSSVAVKGEKGDAGLPAPTNVWIDSVSGLQWLVGSSTNNYWFWNQSCVNSWRKATITELVDANHRGLIQKVQALGMPIIIWRTAQPDTFYKMDDEFVFNTSQTATVVCVK